MAIEFQCPTCGGTLQVGDEAAGRVIRCGGCMTALRVPAVDAASSEPPPPNPYGGQSYPPPPPPPPSRRSSAPTEVEPLPEEPPAAARPVAPRRERDRNEDDEDDRRGRRLPRRPPPPPGKGMFFWLVVIGAVMLVGVIGCCGGLFLMMPEAKWQPHESKPGGFKVELPAKPQPDVAKAAGLRLDKGTHAEGTLLLRRGAIKFVVIYRDIGTARNRGNTDEQELDERVARLQNGMHVEQRSKGVSITVEGFPARELEFQADTGWHKARVIIAHTRLYIVLAGGGTALPGDQDVQQFLDSFKITDPKLVAEGQQREDQAKLAAEAAKAAKERAAKRRAEEEEERKAAEEREAEELREAAETVAGMAFAIAREAKPAPPPPLPVAPPPRPVDE